MAKKIDLFQIATIVSACLLIFVLATTSTSVMVQILAGVALCGAVMASIHHAEVVAKKVGPSLGALILAIAVTVIEVGLILSMMSNGGPNAAVIARDTVFSAVIIVTNGIVGICFLIGGIYHRELEFRVEGASTLLAVLATLVGVTLILPNFTTTTVGPTYSSFQLIFVSVASIILYISLVVSQTLTHKDYFAVQAPERPEKKPSKKIAVLSFVSLVVSLVVVIGLAKSLSPAIESAVLSIKAPVTAVGIVIALLVLLPEAGAALAAAKANQLQTSLNLALGSGVASVALTIPVIAVYSIVTGRQVSLGLGSKEIAFSLLTFLVSGLTLTTGKTTALKGVVHLVILLSFVVLSFIP